MNLKKINIVLLFCGLVLFFTCMSGNLYAASFNKLELKHTNEIDELVYSGRVYGLEKNDYFDYYPSYEDNNNMVTSNITLYQSGKNFIAHQVIRSDEKNKNFYDKWLYSSKNKTQFYEEMANNVKNIFPSYVLGGEGNFSTKCIFPVDNDNIIGWRKIGRLWYFVYKGQITKMKTNKENPKNRIVHGYLISDVFQDGVKFSMLKKPLINNQVIDAEDKEYWGYTKNYSALHGLFWGSIPGHSKNKILIDQFTGKIIYNKRYACYQFNLNKNGRVSVKKFYMRSDKHGHIVKGTYTGLKYRWTFGKNGILLKTRKI